MVDVIIVSMHFTSHINLLQKKIVSGKTVVLINDMDQNEDPSLLLETYFSCGRNYNDSKCYEVARLIKISMKLE